MTCVYEPMEGLEAFAYPRNTLSVDKDAASSDAVNRALLEWINTHLTRVLNQGLNERHYASALGFIDRNYDLITASVIPVLPALGQVGQGQFKLDHEVLRLLLVLVSLGASGSWSMRLDEEIDGYVGTEFVHFDGQVSATSDGRRCEFIFDDNQEHRSRNFRFLSGHWIRETPDVSEFMLSNPFEVSLFCEANRFEDGSLVGNLPLSKTPIREIRRSTQNALQMIQSSFREGYDWIRRVLKGIVFVTTNDGSTTSGSSSSHPGMIFVSHPISEDHLAAQIIHECAHQYLSILHQVRPLTKSDHIDLYYSTFKRTHRPLYNVLLALHAAINIQKLTAKLIENGHRTDYLIQEDQSLREEIEQMSSEVRNSDGLTMTGQQLISVAMNGASHG